MIRLQPNRSFRVQRAKRADASMRPPLILVLSLSTVAVTAALSPRAIPRARMGAPSPANKPSSRQLWGLAGVGAVVGPAVDAVHNQALLAYDVLPVSVDLGLGVAKTRQPVPLLLHAHSPP